MSSSPFLTPGRSGRREALAQRRRAHRRRRLAALAALACGLVLVLALALALAGAAGERTPGLSARVRAINARRAAVRLSPAGLPLAKPAFALGGLATPKLDPLQLAFHKPPREGLLFNLQSGQVLWQRSPLERVRVASLTKMMTALLTVTSEPPNAPVLITKAAVDMQGSKVGVLPLGRHVPLESLLYGLLLPSGNDAAVALAEEVAGSVPAFVARMNREAAALGLGCTRYSSPSGYYDADNFSCAADLAVLAHEDLSQPRIAAVTRTYQAVIPFPIKGGKLYLDNNNPLLIYDYPGTTGLKTGYTEAAGRCLVGTAERHGVRLGAIVLDSSEPGRQVRALLNAGFQGIYHQRPVSEAEMPPGA
jgi:D-alanyl-D-alanine carboxypeptidase